MAVSKNTIKRLKSLYQKKFRQKYNNFIAEGDKIVREMLIHEDFQIHQLFALPNWLAENQHLLEGKDLHVQEINEARVKTNFSIIAA